MFLKLIIVVIIIVSDLSNDKNSVLSQVTQNVYVVQKPTVKQVYDTAVHVTWYMSPKALEHILYMTLEKQDTTSIPNSDWKTVHFQLNLHFYLTEYYVTGLQNGGKYKFRLKFFTFDPGLANLSSISDEIHMTSMGNSQRSSLSDKPFKVESSFLWENTDGGVENSFFANLSWQFNYQEPVEGFRILVCCRDGLKVVAGYVNKTQLYFVFKTWKHTSRYAIQVQTFNYKVVGSLTNSITQCNRTMFDKDCSKECHCTRNATCSSIGVCSDNQCASGWMSSNAILKSCQKPCSMGRYGNDCKHRCGKCKNSHTCNATTGYCPSCKLHYNPPLCQACTAGLYGENCTEQCGKCYNNESCDTTNGYCASCKLNFHPPFCEDCVPKKYGSSCDQDCHCYQNYDCDRTTGSCGRFGCAKYWGGIGKCDQKYVCPKGYYGKNCIECGQCKMTCSDFDKTCLLDCDRVTGDCLTTECKPFFVGIRCDRCTASRYGVNCKHKCGHCFKDMCNERDGLCTLGCQRGYMGYKCDLKCKPGLYGDQCAHPCGKCADQVSCNFETGECPDKCETGYKGNNCDELVMPACPQGQFGKYCEKLCGVCYDEKICNSTDGSCPTGCVGRYIPPLCLECESSYFGKECDQKCGHCKSQAICDSYTGACPHGCAEDFTGPYCKKRLKKAKIDYGSFDFDEF